MEGFFFGSFFFFLLKKFPDALHQVVMLKQGIPRNK
jgi:hypothetical protein